MASPKRFWHTFIAVGVCVVFMFSILAPQAHAGIICSTSQNTNWGVFALTLEKGD